MTRDEPISKHLSHHDQYQIVNKDLTLPQVAAKFAEHPDDVLLVYDSENDKFLGALYLYDFNRVYANPPKRLKKIIHKSVISDVMNANVVSIEWTANISQVWGLANIKRPHAIILKDEKKRFAGYLSNEDLWSAMEMMESAPKTASP